MVDPAAGDTCPGAVTAGETPVACPDSCAAAGPPARERTRKTGAKRQKRTSFRLPKEKLVTVPKLDSRSRLPAFLAAMPSCVDPGAGPQNMLRRGFGTKPAKRPTRRIVRGWATNILDYFIQQLFAGNASPAPRIKHPGRVRVAHGHVSDGGRGHFTTGSIGWFMPGNLGRPKLTVSPATTSTSGTRPIASDGNQRLRGQHADGPPHGTGRNGQPGHLPGQPRAVLRHRPRPPRRWRLRLLVERKKPAQGGLLRLVAGARFELATFRL